MLIPEIANPFSFSNETLQFADGRFNLPVLQKFLNVIRDCKIPKHFHLFTTIQKPNYKGQPVKVELMKVETIEQAALAHLS